VRCVNAAGVEEADCGADAEAGEDGEVANVLGERGVKERKGGYLQLVGDGGDSRLRRRRRQ
jgi:hypothetical protein